MAFDQVETITKSVLWRRLDQEGHESVSLRSNGDGFQLAGVAIFVFRQQTCGLNYFICCDPQWRTMFTKVDGWIGTQQVRCEVSVDRFWRWHFNGSERPDLDECADIDLNFSPCTNTLAIRRLNLAIGQSSRVQAAWLRFPRITLERLEQVYTRVSGSRYRYESAGGKFVTELEIDAEGLVYEYPKFWQAVAAL